MDRLLRFAADDLAVTYASCAAGLRCGGRLLRKGRVDGAVVDPDSILAQRGQQARFWVEQADPLIVVWGKDA